jgi:hypothetical protein
MSGAPFIICAKSRYANVLPRIFSCLAQGMLKHGSESNPRKWAPIDVVHAHSPDSSGFIRVGPSCFHSRANATTEPN